MKNVQELITAAAKLSNSGASNGEIADELNVSRDTASWLVRKSDAGAVSQIAGETARSRRDREYRPQDIHVDWSTIGRKGSRLTHVGGAMADVLHEEGGNADLTIGVEKAGVPIATTIAQECETNLGSYAPAKHQWETGDIKELDGSFSQNFSRIQDADCYIVDDTITSGTTMRETVEAIRKEGGNPVACAVLVDKQGIDEIDSVPVASLIDVARVGEV